MADGGPDRSAPVIVRWATAFGRFWWDFLIGDTPELFVGVVAVLGALALACLRPELRTVAALAAPVLIAGVLTTSVHHAARKRDR